MSHYRNSYINLKLLAINSIVFTGGITKVLTVEDIEDIVQETFVKSYEANLKQEIRYERTYMLKTARNLALNHVTRAEHVQSQQIDDMDALPHDLVGYTLEKNVESKERFLN